MKYLLLIDIFNSEEVKLIGRRKHRTFLGALLSISLLCVLGSVFVSLIRDLAQRINPSVIFYQELVPNPGPLDVPKDGFLVAFYMEWIDAKGNTLENVESVAVLQWILPNGESLRVDFVKCRLDEDFIDRYDTKSNIDLELIYLQGYCLNMTQYDKVQNKFILMGNQYNQNDPLSFPIINLSGYCESPNATGQGAIFISDFTVNQKIQQPLAKYYRRNDFILSPFSRLTETRHLTQIDFLDKFDPFFQGNQDIMLQAYTEQSRDAFNRKSAITGLAISWDLHPIKITYQRTYGTILNVLAQLSGLYGALSFVIIFIVEPFFQTNLFLQLQKSLEKISKNSAGLNSQLDSFTLFKVLFRSEKAVFQQNSQTIEQSLCIEQIYLTIRKLQILEEILLNQKQRQSLKTLSSKYVYQNQHLDWEEESLDIDQKLKRLLSISQYPKDPAFDSNSVQKENNVALHLKNNDDYQIQKEEVSNLGHDPLSKEKILPLPQKNNEKEAIQMEMVKEDKQPQQIELNRVIDS